MWIIMKYIIRFIANLPALGVGFACIFLWVFSFEPMVNHWFIKLILLFSLCSCAVTFVKLISEFEENVTKFKNFLKRLSDDTERSDLPIKKV